MILILSQRSDRLTLQPVIDILAKNSHRYTLLDTTRLHETTFELSLRDSKPRLKIQADDIPFHEIKSVWVRRPYAWLSDDLSPLMAHMRREMTVLTEGMLHVLGQHGVFVLNQEYAARIASNKAVQWDAFQALNIPAPQTKFTNDLSNIRSGTKVVKQLGRQGFSVDKVDYILPTKLLMTQELRTLKDSQKPPLLLQDHLDIDYEIRATVINDNVFAARIDYDATRTHDYRLLLYKSEGIHHKRWNLPENVRDDCIKLLAHFGLYFGCIDIAVDKDGKHWFLEINPNGQWGWIQEETGLPIAEAIAELLANPPARTAQPT